MTATVPAPTGFEPLDPAIREQYDRDGFVVIPNVLTEDDRAYSRRPSTGSTPRRRPPARLHPGRTLHLLGFLDRDELFGELLTHPVAFPYMWGTGRLEHLHPPQPPRRRRRRAEPEQPYWGWHQDGYRQNSDPETMDPNLPRPMFSLKVAYVALRPVGARAAARPRSSRAATCGTRCPARPT